MIDTDMDDELRVTVVATGLGAEQFEKPKVVDVQTKVAGDAPEDYGKFDKPTVTRNRLIAGGADEIREGKDLEYLDIPAFLRRQAD